MPKVIYDGNGFDGGLIPVDSNTYNVGDTVNVAGNYSTMAQQQQKDGSGNPENILTGNLTRTGAFFLYWSTTLVRRRPNPWLAPGHKFYFPNQTGDLTLFAQWAITTGLTNNGVTAHYALR